jgi:hypothetical protein
MTSSRSSVKTSSPLSKVWRVVSGRAAREHAVILSDLEHWAFVDLERKGAKRGFRQHNIVTEAVAGAYGNKEYALRNLVKHLPQHDAQNIVNAIGEARIAGRSETELLTHNHILVCEKLTRDDTDLYKAGPNSTAMDEFKKVVAYAMTHIEDGDLIVSALYDRGIGTLDGILDILPELRATNHSTLTEGIL